MTLELFLKSSCLNNVLQIRIHRVSSVTKKDYCPLTFFLVSRGQSRAWTFLEVLGWSLAFFAKKLFQKKKKKLSHCS